MAQNTVNISVPVRFEIKSPPRGMMDYDPKALSGDQQNELNHYKIFIRKENVIYLAGHPEVKAVLSLVERMARIHQPRNIFKFVSTLFSRPERELRQEVQNIVHEYPIEHETIPYCEFEDWDY